ncbi:response regulator [uncultured Paludibaculum sp.]|uniref:response regulator n=1 Tax=uncultured Paludibaculum sp. TaxID=1765020 RepID=UPI002AAC13FE|nr:response regulator [uncultured Paludibaculum sp.]
MNKKILAVDDSSTVRQMVSFTLTSAGYEVIEAKDGQDALSKLTSPVPLGMVLTDLNMPNLDGIGLIKRLRAHGSFKYVPIVVLTTESEVEKKQAARSAGATAWIVKPFRPEQLLAVIQKVLG